MLYIVDILKEKTDENHPLSATEICEELQEYGISAERKAIYDDLRVLEEYGYDIIKTCIPARGFYLGSRKFEMAEVRLLSDAVQAAGFISSKKTNILLEKLISDLSDSQKEDLENQVYVENRVKTENETIYYTLTFLSDAIKRGVKVRLRYIKRVIGDKGQLKTEERIFRLSPYGIIWSQDHYYLVCNNEKYNNFMHIRVERIKNVEVLDDPIRPVSEFSGYTEYFDSADYTGRIFGGYTGEIKRVELLCDNEIIQEVEDRFGTDLKARRVGENHFTVTVQVAVSDGFVDWIMRFGSKITVKSPNELRERVKEKALSIYEMY